MDKKDITKKERITLNWTSEGREKLRQAAFKVRRSASKISEESMHYYVDNNLHDMDDPWAKGDFDADDARNNEIMEDKE